MKILWNGFAATNHSWSHVAQNISRSLIKAGHDVDIFSTNGVEFFPKDLRSNLIGYVEENKNDKIYGRPPSQDYDCQLSYTALKNFPNYLRHGNKNRFGIWCYEWSGKNVLPTGFAKHYKSCDKLLPPSNHAKQVFLDSGIPESAMEVTPHGVDQEFISGIEIFPLATDKKFKVLSNIAQPHLRKNLPGILESWGKAFNKNDDVCLVLKISKKIKNQNFEVNFDELYNDFNKKYPNHAEVLVIDYFIEDISSLYRACNCVLSLSFCESFLLPALEALSSNKLLIVSADGGQMDFCNNNNSLFVSGKYIRADPRMMYWEPKLNAAVFKPDENIAAQQLRFAYDNEQVLLKKFSPEFSNIRENYTWDKVASKILSLCK